MVLVLGVVGLGLCLGTVGRSLGLRVAGLGLGLDQLRFDTNSGNNSKQLGVMATPTSRLGPHPYIPAGSASTPQSVIVYQL